MVWRYTAVNMMARDVTGLESGSRSAIESRLTGAGLIIVSLSLDWGQSFRGLVFGGEVPPEKLAFFFRDFSNMLGAGLALDHILRIFKDTAGDLRLIEAVGRISEELAVGGSLAAALEATKFFPRLAVRALSAGEKAGNMPLVMGLLADHFELTSALKGKCLGALIYPVFVLLFLLISFVYVSGVVVPQLAPLLPAQALCAPLTRVMLAVSAGMRQSWIMLVCSAGTMVIGFVAFFRCRPRAWEVLLDAMPLLGPVHRDLQISMCFFDLFILLKSGIPLDAALADAASCADVPARRALGQCREFLTVGHTFSSALSVTGYFPRLVVETVRLGEETGRYDDYCGRIFQFYHRSFGARVGVMAAVLQPLMLGICGLFVAVMALAFLKPIYANLTQIGTIQQ